MMTDSTFLSLAASEAEKYIGATSPNPPVGACLVKDDRVLSLAAHLRAGAEHAEAAVLRHALERYGPDAARGATIYVTLEPCNHQGRTRPCVRTVIESGISRVVFGARDPNANVQGGGAEALSRAGIQVDARPEHLPSQRLINGFQKVMFTGLPWVVHKIAYRSTAPGQLTMVPEPGAKTFTSSESLRAAHNERRKCDAILTGVGTITADAPLFNVRHVADHEGKQRTIAIVSRSARALPQAWVAHQHEFGTQILESRSVEAALKELGRQGALRVLVEAGPLLSNYIVKHRLWDERLVFIQHDNYDHMVREYRCSPEL